ncbi:MAG TPA: TIGR03767 family metallophosphoesterase, partial [Acidimicrobiales bacterium]
RWWVDVLAGREITPNTGVPGRYEGIQRADVGWAWHPDHPAKDHYGRVGFPELPGFLDAAVQPFHPVGLDVPWLAVMGNHDSVFQGSFGPMPGLRFDKMGDLLVGASRKVTGVAGLVRALAHATVRGTDPARWDRGRRGPGTIRVTADPAARRRLDRREYVQALLDDRDGPGPAGHGFTPANAEDGTAWWSRPHGERIQLIGLDTCNHTRGSEGSLSEAHWQWLDAELRRHHTSWRDGQGRWQEGEGPDRLCILFSHHNSSSMTSTTSDDHFPGHRYQGPELVALLHRFPNVVAWVNGHSHEHSIDAHPRPADMAGPGSGAGFWEINTASCIDFGQQSRTVELVDNADGTLSFFTTVLDHGAPPSVSTKPAGGWTPSNLASMSRELSANDARWTDPFDLLGDVEDRNTELLLPSPIKLA